jgi:hypothetical protein
MEIPDFMRSCRNDLTMMMTSYSYLPLFCLIEIPPSSSAACESENMSSVGGNYHYRPWILDGVDDEPLQLHSVAVSNLDE